MLTTFPDHHSRLVILRSPLLEADLTNGEHILTLLANWQKGDDVIVHPSVQGDKVKELFGDNVKTVYVSS